MSCSVVIPAYNASTCINDALASVHSQKQQPIEVIVVDDGSSDNTVELAQAWADRLAHLRVLPMARNSGAAAARNTGVRAAKGQFIAFLDADDVWRPNKLMTQLAPFADDEVVITGCWYEIAEAGRRRVVRQPIDAPARIAHSNVFGGTSNVIVRTQVFSACGGFCEDMKTHEDWILFAMLCARGRATIVQEVLGSYRGVLPSAARLSKNKAAFVESAETAFVRIEELCGARLEEGAAYRHRRDLATKLILEFGRLDECWAQYAKSLRHVHGWGAALDAFLFWPRIACLKALR